MKQIIEGKLYNTETAEYLFNVSNGLGGGDFRNFNFDVYRTKKGAYFLAGAGGPMSLFAQPCGNMTGGGRGIQVLSKNEALTWAETRNSNADVDRIAEIFGDQIEEA